MTKFDAMLRRRRGEWLTIFSIIAVAERFFWSLRQGLNTTTGEAYGVVAALVGGRGFADAYFVGAGPTAHLLPTPPLIAAAFVSLGGRDPWLAWIFLQFLAAAEMLVCYFLLYDIFGRIGVGIKSRMAAFAFLCLVPLFLGQESRDFRVWEVGLATMFGLASLRTILQIDEYRPNAHQLPITVRLVFLLAITAFISPPFAMGLAVCAVVLGIRRWTWNERLRTGLSTILLTTLIFAPWVIRNEQVFGRLVIIRSNAPLELAVANNDTVSADSSLRAFDSVMNRIHPFRSGGAAARVRQIGELAYMDELFDSTTAWILTNPDKFARLCLRHMRQMMFPDTFQFQQGSGKFAAERAAVFALLSLLAILAIIVRSKQRRFDYLYIGIVIATLALTYAPFQPVARYMYLIYGLVTFAAFDGIGIIAGARRTHASWLRAWR